MTSAYCTANGLPVISGTISRPRTGAWRADLRVETADPSLLAGQVKLTLGTSERVFVGTARRVGQHHLSTYVRVVGGAGGLPKAFSPKAYRGVPLRLPLQDVLAAAGETLAPSSAPAALATSLPFWQARAQSCGEALASLVAEADGAPVWRVLPDGTIWIGQETWSPSALVTFDEIEFEPHLGRAEIAADDPDVAPGQTFQGKLVSYVEHQIAPHQLRHLVWYEDGAPGAIDRVKGGLSAFVRSLFARIDYLARYPAKVVAQGSDGSLELVPDDARLPGMSGVPIRYGVPGIKATVAPGARVLVGFAAGDPSKPEAELWESASVTRLDISATLLVLNGGSSPIARVGDATPAGPISGPGNLTVLA